MAKLIEIERIIKVIFKMEMASFIVPPALGKNKYIRGTKRRKRNTANRADLPPRNFGLDIDRIFAAVIPGGIAPCGRIKGSRQRRLHEASQRKHKNSKAF